MTQVFSKLGCFIDVADWWDFEGYRSQDEDALREAKRDGGCPKCSKKQDLTAEEGYVFCQNCGEWEWDSDTGWHKINQNK